MLAAVAGLIETKVTMWRTSVVVEACNDLHAIMCEMAFWNVVHLTSSYTADRSFCSSRTVMHTNSLVLQWIFGTVAHVGEAPPSALYRSLTKTVKFETLQPCRVASQNGRFCPVAVQSHLALPRRSEMEN